MTALLRGRWILRVGCHGVSKPTLLRPFYTACHERRVSIISIGGVRIRRVFEIIFLQLCHQVCGDVYASAYLQKTKPITPVSLPNSSLPKKTNSIPQKLLCQFHIRWSRPQSFVEANINRMGSSQYLMGSVGRLHFFLYMNGCFLWYPPVN